MHRFDRVRSVMFREKTASISDIRNYFPQRADKELFSPRFSLKVNVRNSIKSPKGEAKYKSVHSRCGRDLWSVLFAVARRQFLGRGWLGDYRVVYFWVADHPHEEGTFVGQGILPLLLQCTAHIHQLLSLVLVIDAQWVARSKFIILKKKLEKKPCIITR